MFIIIVFILGSDKLVCYLSYCFLRDQSRDATIRLGEDKWFLIFDCSSISFSVNWISLLFGKALQAGHIYWSMRYLFFNEIEYDITNEEPTRF